MVGKLGCCEGCPGGGGGGGGGGNRGPCFTIPIDHAAPFTDTLTGSPLVFAQTGGLGSFIGPSGITMMGTDEAGFNGADFTSVGWPSGGGKFMNTSQRMLTIRQSQNFTSTARVQIDTSAVDLRFADWLGRVGFKIEHSYDAPEYPLNNLGLITPNWGVRVTINNFGSGWFVAAHSVNGFPVPPYVPVTLPGSFELSVTRVNVANYTTSIITTTDTTRANGILLYQNVAQFSFDPLVCVREPQRISFFWERYGNGATGDAVWGRSYIKFLNVTYTES